MTASARGEDRAASAWLERLTLGLLAFYLALSAYVLWRAAVLAPYSDEIDWIQHWRDLKANGDWTGYLLAPVNLHRLPWMFGLIALDIDNLGGTNIPLIVSGAFSVAAMAWMLAREAAWAAPPPLAAPAAAVAAMLALMAGIVLDAATPICVNYTHGAVCAVAAIVLAEGGVEDGLSWRRAAALLAAIIAALGDAAALAVWPVLAFGGLRRRDWTWLSAVLLLGAVFIGLYASGQGAQTASSTHSARQHPLTALHLSLNYLALPWVRLSLGWAWLGGLAIAAVGLAAVAFRGGPRASNAERIACGLILFTFGTAAMAGLGRSGQPDPLNVPLRYSVLLTPLHVGGLMLALPYAGQLWRKNRSFAQGVIAAALVLLAAQNTVMAVKVIEAGDMVRGAVAAFRDGRRSSEMTTLVYPDLARATRVYDRLDRDDLFQHELHLKPQARPR